MSATKRVTRAQRRMVVSQSEDIEKVEKNETETHPAQAEEDISGGNVEELFVPDEIVDFISATYPEDTDKGGQEEGTSCTINQESPSDLPNNPRENTLGEEDSRKSQEDLVVFSSEEKWDSKVEITPIPENTGRGGQQEGTSCTREEISGEQDNAKSQVDQEVVHSQEKLDSEMENTPVPDTDRDDQEQGISCTINQESPADLLDKSRENTLEEEVSGKSQADQVVVHSQEKQGSEMENTPIPEDADRGGLEEGTSCTINQESPADLPIKSCGEEGSGKSEAEPVVVHLHVQEKLDSEMEDAPIPEDTDEGGQEEETSCTIDQESPADLPEKPAMEELFDPKWVELIQLLPEKSDPELELKEKDHQVGHITHKFLYPVPMLPLADSVKQQWEEVNKDLTEDTSKIVPVRREDEKRFWTNNTDYRKYCQSSTIDDDYCTEVAYEIRARQAYRGSFIKKSFAIQDPLLHTCENSFKKCDESARMMVQASSHAVLMLNAVENILKTCPSDRQSDALLMIEGIQGALECIANTSARVIARSTISRRTICMSQIHHNKPESIKKILTLPMDTKDLFHGEFKKMLDKKPRAKKRKLSDNSTKSNEEPSTIKCKHQPPLEKPAKSNKKSNAKDRQHQPPLDNRQKKKHRRPHVTPRFGHPRPPFDDRDPYGGTYSPPGQFPLYPRERVPPYPHGRVPPYPHGRVPHYPQEHVPPYPHERAPPYPHEHVGSYPYDYEHVSPYPRGHGEYNEEYHFGSGRGRFAQQGGSDFAGQQKFTKNITQEGMNKNAQERIRERLNQKGHS